MTVELMLTLAVPLVANLLAIGVAYGRISAKLEAQDNMIKLLTDELKTVRGRLHDLGNRMGAPSLAALLGRERSE